MKGGINSNDIKVRNRGLVLKYIAISRSISRSDITKKIGLTKMTVSNIVAELIEEGYVVEKEVSENRSVGRNPITLAIAPSAPKILGISITRDSIQVFLSDLSCQIQVRREVSLQKENAVTLKNKLISCVTDVMQNHSAKILGIGVSSMGPIDHQAGTLLNPVNFFGIKNFPVKQILEEQFHLPVVTNSDMNAAALAEHLLGIGTSYSDFVYLGITNGIGAGIIANQKLYEGSWGQVGEIGHTGINYEGPLCSCGRRGCLECYANMPLIMDRLKAAVGRNRISYLDFETIKEIPECDMVFQEVIHALSYALTNICNLLDPQVIIFGHEGSYLPKSYLKQLEDIINASVLSNGHNQILVRTSLFGMEAPAIGSICVFLNTIFSGHFPI